MAIFVSGCDKLVLMASDKYASWSANKYEVQLSDKYGLHHIFCTSLQVTMYKSSAAKMFERGCALNEAGDIDIRQSN